MKGEAMGSGSSRSCQGYVCLEKAGNPGNHKVRFHRGCEALPSPSFLGSTSCLDNETRQESCEKGQRMVVIAKVWEDRNGFQLATG